MISEGENDAHIGLYLAQKINSLLDVMIDYYRHLDFKHVSKEIIRSPHSAPESLFADKCPMLQSWSLTGWLEIIFYLERNFLVAGDVQVLHFPPNSDSLSVGSFLRYHGLGRWLD